MLDAATIKKYSKYSTAQLRKKAGEKFRAWIRRRDADQPCISCGSWNVTDAGHYYSAGHHPEVEFNELNVNGQCKRCNLFLSGNLIEYRKGLIQKIGEENLHVLENIVAVCKQTGYKHDRYRLIEVIENYK